MREKRQRKHQEVWARYEGLVQEEGRQGSGEGKEVVKEGAE